MRDRRPAKRIAMIEDYHHSHNRRFCAERRLFDSPKAAHRHQRRKLDARTDKNKYPTECQFLRVPLSIVSNVLSNDTIKERHGQESRAHVDNG